MAHTCAFSDVDDIMVMCKISEDGYINFTSFAQHVADARIMSNNNPVAKAKGVRASSGSTPVQPLRPSDAHKMMRDAERQSTVIRLKEKEIRGLYEDFDDGQLSSEKFKDGLKSLGLTITSDCESLLRRSECSSTPFNLVLRALCVQDHGGPPLDGTFVAASAAAPVNMMAGSRTVKGGEFGARKRTDPRRAESVLSASGSTTEKANVAERGTGSRKGKFFSHSDGVRSTLDMGAGKTLISSARLSDVHGMSGVEPSQAGSGVNCEQKMLRQQIFSLIRKMDGGEISARDFQDKLFTMGFEIPAGVLQLLKNYDSSGKADFKQFVRAFEKYFDSRSGESCANPEKLEEIKASLAEHLKEQGASSVADLAKVFREMNDDGGSELSLSEFKRGMKTLGLNQIDETDMRLLFNSFDIDGNGQLSYSEFLVAIRGDIPAQRLRLVRQAFTALDKTGTNCINTDDLRAVYDPTHHPDVLAGKITVDAALVQVLDAFDSGEKDGVIDFGEFLEYYANLSSSIVDNSEFERMLTTAWNLEHLPPPPAMYSRKKDGSVVTKPLAGQNHGDILNWNQQPSQLEHRQQLKNKEKRSGHIDAHESEMNVHSWTQGEIAQKALDEEQSHMFGSKSKQMFSRTAVGQTNNILSWDQHKRSAEPEKKKTAEVEVVWQPGHKKKLAAGSMHFGRPSPFGVDEESTAYKIVQEGGSPSKEGQGGAVRSLADMLL